MPDISAFRGIRYDLGHVGSLSNVIAPPYDVIDADLQRALYDRHPANVVRLILNRDEPGDDDHNNRYSRAARLLRSWLRDGILFTESDPAIYAYHQVFDYAGATYTRRGFMCRVRLEPFGTGNIFPHEETHSGAKVDRFKLGTACKANLSQVFGLYPDAEDQAQRIVERTIAGVAPLEATDHLGVVHRLWPVTDIRVITELSGAMGGRPICIADGHHRYETACMIRDQVAAEFAKRGETLPAEHPANHVLMMCVSMSDPGLRVLPTHRLFRGLRPMTSRQLADRLSECFSLEVQDAGPREADLVWAEIENADAQGCMAFFTAEDQKWTIARITEAGRQRMASIAPEHGPEWRGLGVSILHRLVVDTLLAEQGAGCGEPGVLRAPRSVLPAPKYVHNVDEVVHGLVSGDDAGRDATGQVGNGGRFELAALVMPATVEDVRAISTRGERMPPKSTYFYPKLLSGLVINPLDS